MNERQSRSFSGFLFAFMAIIAAAFGVLVWAGLQTPEEVEQNIEPVDNVALPN